MLQILKYAFWCCWCKVWFHLKFVRPMDIFLHSMCMKKVIKLNRIFCHYFFICFVLILLFWKRKLRPFLHLCLIYLLAVIGIFLISWTLYNRLFRDRPVKPLPIGFSSYWQLTYVLLFITALISVISIIYRLIRKYLNKESKELHPVVVKLLTFLGKLSDSYYKPHITVYNKVLKKHFGFHMITIILKIENFMLTYTLNCLKLIIILVEILPRFIVAIALFIDVFVFHEFYYFYRALTLMLIVLVYRGGVYILRDFNRSWVEQFGKFLKITPAQKETLPDGTVKITQVYVEVNVDGLGLPEEFHKTMVDYYLLSQQMENHLDDLEDQKNIYYYSYYFTRLVITLLYLSSWGMVVIGLFFIDIYIYFL